MRGIPYSETRQAIDLVFREHSTVNMPEVELDISTGGTGRFLALSIALMQIETGAPDLAVISVYDVTDQVLTRRQLEAAQAEQNQLMNEISAANRRLNDMNKELLDSNEELQVANEELILTHEELQATIEEFESTNEELQATNKELETNNEELQATNEELQTTNEELRARSSELQEVGGMLDIERSRLSEIIQQAPCRIVVLKGPKLQVEALNLQQEQGLDIPKVWGRPLQEVSDLFGDQTDTLLEIAREVYQNGKAQSITHLGTQADSQTPATTGQKGYDYDIVPSHGLDGKVEGVIIYALTEYSPEK